VRLLFLSICLNPVLQKTIVLQGFGEGYVNRSSEYYLDAAGKGIHVSRVLAQLNEQVTHITQVGGRFKEAFLQLAAREEFKLAWVDSDAEIRFCYTLVNKKKRTTTEIVELGEVIALEIERAVLDRFRSHIKKNNWLILSGTKAPGFSDELFPHMVKTAKELGKSVFLDIREDDLLNSLKYRPDFIKLNAEEFFTTFYPDTVTSLLKNKTKLAEAAQGKLKELYGRYGIHTIITNGEQRIMYNQQHRVDTLLPRSIDALNTTGCGDAFCAGFVSEYARTEDLYRAVCKGEECARRNALLIRPGRIMAEDEGGGEG
jgi:tagatose 6-phosphate kinase